MTAIRPRVASETLAIGTSCSVARSTKSARSPPLSWMLAIPRPVCTRRGDENSSIASAISSSDRTSCTPYASKTASYAPCSPASAPECATTNAFEASVRPTVSAKTGTSRSAARASAARNPPGFRTVSSSIAITRVVSRSSANRRYASIGVTTSCPLDTSRSNPIPRSLNAKAANAEPLWERKVTGPGRRSSGVANPVARSLPGTFTNPIPLPPHTAMPCAAAIAATRSASDGPSDASS